MELEGTVASVWQQVLLSSTKILRYTYIAYLVIFSSY